LAKTSIIQSAWGKKQEVNIHGWVYSVNDGIIKDLNLTISNDETLNKVYQLDF
jgi:carbonic anhydrase